MTRHLVVFIVTFAIGAVIAVILRTGSHKPYEEHRGHPTPGTASAAPATAYDAADPHAGHAAPVTTPAPMADDMPGMVMPNPAKKHPEPDAAPGSVPMTMPMPTPATPEMTPAVPVPAPEHAGHDHHASEAPAPMAAPVAAVATAGATVNTICPGCGDPVDPKLPFADYKGKKIGFGCAMCPPKFKADPVKYGEAALKNQVAE